MVDSEKLRYSVLTHAISTGSLAEEAAPPTLPSLVEELEKQPQVFLERIEGSIRPIHFQP